jgi:ABC-type uncharacterized transport system substrate-binding protein
MSSVANGLAGVVNLQQATRTIPIVFVLVGEPVARGLVQSLAHPGGNITGPPLLGDMCYVVIGR